MKKPEYVYAICGYHTYRTQEIHFFGFFLDEKEAQKEVNHLNCFTPPEAEFKYIRRTYEVGTISKSTLNQEGQHPFLNS